ncbi:hypothetical protein PG984_016021 [Apiospora sp. TS-2023a]
MISRKISSGAICLGCRLRLLSQATRPRYPHSVTRYTTAVTSRRQPSRWFTNDQLAARPTENGQSHDDELKSPNETELATEPRDNSFYKSDFFTTDDPGKDYIRHVPIRGPEEEDLVFKKLNVSKRRLSRNRLLSEASESLGQDMLGKPAYAIVMKDLGLYKSNKRSAEAADTATAREESSQLEIQALLDQQDAPATAEEVRANIDGLCPDSETYLPEKEFRRIQHELTEGFLKSQLSDYIDRFKAALEKVTEPEVETEETEEMEESPENKHNDTELEGQASEAQKYAETGEASPSGEGESTAPAPRYPWIREISPWVRLNSDEVAAGGLPEYADQHLHGYISEKASVKEVLALRIMRECWGLHIEELMGGLGQVEITVRKLEFSMLMRGTRRFLKLLTDLFLDRGESMEVFTKRHTIRFVSTRPKAEVLIHELDVMLQNLVTRHFPVSKIAGEHDLIDDVLLEEVGRISNTYVKQSQSTKKIAVTWIETRGRKVKESEYDVEDLRHVVLRLLLTALQPEAALVRLYEPKQLPEDFTGRFLVDEYNREKWSWKDKLGRVLEGATDLDESKIAELKEAEIEVQAPPRRYPHQPVRWSPEVHTATSAVFGHVLLDAMGLPAEALISERDQTRLGLSSYPHIFSPIVPHPMQLAALHGGAQPDGRGDDEPYFSVEHTILIRLMPSPVVNPAIDLRQPGPPLELRLALTDSNDPEITGVHSLRAIVETHVHDAMLPSAPVDARVLQRRIATLQGHPEDLAAWQPLQSFLGRARLDIAYGKLEMPSQQRFQIPARLFYKSHPPAISKPISPKKQAKREKLDQKLESKLPADKNEPVSIPYDFMGLELHRAVSVPYEGHTLTYTSIEAGQGGGRRAELTLSPTTSSTDVSMAGIGEESKTMEEQAPMNDFLNLMYKTAQTAKFWSGFAG